MHKKLIAKIEFEIAEIDKELESYSSLIKVCSIKEPELIEKTAAASVLHTFYTGIENILLGIAKDIDKSVPSGKNWHKTLLLSMACSNDARPSFISESSLTVLLDYLGFRHFYRHSYSFHLDWDQMGKLITGINDIWNNFCVELSGFVKWLKDKQ